MMLFFYKYNYNPLWFWNWVFKVQSIVRIDQIYQIDPHGGVNLEQNEAAKVG